MSLSAPLESLCCALRSLSDQAGASLEYVFQVVIRIQRDTLAAMLRSHGEDDLADRAESFSEDQLARIGRLGAYYAWSEDAIALGGSMGGARALSLATIDVIEDSQRELRRHHTEAEIEYGLSERPTADERAADHALRRHAAEKQQSPEDA